MFRKKMVSDRLDQLQLAVDRLKSSLVVPADPGDAVTPTEVILQQLQQIENQIDYLVNLVLNLLQLLYYDLDWSTHVAWIHWYYQT